MGLAMHDHRIDAAADIVDARVAGDLDAAGVGVDLDLAHAGAVGEHLPVHFVVAPDFEAVCDFRQT